MTRADVDYIQDPATGRFQGSHPHGGTGGEGQGKRPSGEGSREGGRSGARSAEQAQRDAEKAAAGQSKLDGLPDKPIKIGESYYVPGPYGKARDAAVAYTRKAGLPYNPPKTYQKVDKERATRIASEFDKMKHAPDDPAVKASYDALAKETLAQWQTIKATGLKIDWIKPDAPDPYAKTPRLAAMDVTQNNHLWVFPTVSGFGSGGEAAEAAKHSNPMLQDTGEVINGHRALVNDVFRIVHDYFGHFKDGNGFRADGEENAWRSHSAMYSDLARPAMTSETRGQNSWVNFGPHGEANRAASAADTVYAPQKIGLMPDWAMNEGRGDPGKKLLADLLYRTTSLVARDVDYIQDPTTGRFQGSHGHGGTKEPSEKPAASAKLDPEVVSVGGDQFNQSIARELEAEYQEARPEVEKLANDAVGGEVEAPPSEEEEEPVEEPFIPEEWDTLSQSGQDQAEKEYIEWAHDDGVSNESDYYYSEYAPHEAREKVASDFNDSTEYEWAADALAELRENRIEEGKQDFPFTDEQILNAIEIEFEGNPGGSVKDPDINFDDDELTEPAGYEPTQQTLPGIEPLQPHEFLTEDMRSEIDKALTRAFDKEGDDVAGKLDVPEWVGENVDESSAESFALMENSEKFEWTKSHTSIVDDESTGVPEKQSVQSIESDQVDALPETYDPLNATSGTSYQRTQRLARYLSVERAMQVLKERGLVKPVSEIEQRELRNSVSYTDRNLWQGWKGSSTGFEGKLLQVATADELGGRLNPHSIDQEKTIAGANKNYQSIGGYAGVKAYVRAKWEVTQFLLDKAGIKTLNVYRGLSIDKDKYDKNLEARHYAASQEVAVETPVGKLAWKYMPTLDVVRNGAASTTTDISVANGWRAGHSTGIVLRAQVPRTAAVSVPAYGINVHSEHEVVVAGTAWKGWDAWAGKAPTLDVVPLRHAA